MAERKPFEGKRVHQLSEYLNTDYDKELVEIEVETEEGWKTFKVDLKTLRSKGDKGDKGDAVKGLPYVATLAERDALVDVEEASFIVVSETKHGYLFTDGEWIDQGDLSGEKGDEGKPGEPTEYDQAESEEVLPPPVETKKNKIFFVGKHLYAIINDEWVDLGDFSGPRGLDNYELAKQEGFQGTLEEWLLSIRGQDGIGLRILGSFTDIQFLPEEGMESGDAYIINEKMYVWAAESWEPVGQVGPAGMSAYQLAVKNGYEGTEQQWLASLRGPKGDPGKNALEVVMENDPEIRSYEDWQLSLRGPRGLSALEVAMAEEPETITDYASWKASIKGERGETAFNSIVIGKLDSVDDLPETGTEGYGYNVAGEVHTWYDGAYIPIGKFEGDQGEPGKDALEVAKENDPEVVDYETWRLSIKGDTGNPGSPAILMGEVETVQELPTEGVKDGSQYYVGDRTYSYFDGKWNDVAKRPIGPQGLDALETAKANDPEITDYDSWRASITGGVGPAGRPAIVRGEVFEVAELPEEGNVDGDIYYVGERIYSYFNDQWNDVAARMKGIKGDAGKNALEVAIDEDPEVTDYESWRLSLKGDKGEQGNPGSTILPKHVVASLDDITFEPEEELLIRVGNNAYVYRSGEWIDLGPWGIEGDQGKPGKSALEVAIETEEAITDYDTWKASLKGDKGEQGDPINPRGEFESLEAVTDPAELDLVIVKGELFVFKNGDWVSHGTVKGTKGDQGDDALKVVMDNDPSITTYVEWQNSLRGETGKDALEVAMANDPAITSYETWRNSLKGDPGAPAKPLNPRGAFDSLDAVENPQDMDFVSVGKISYVYHIDSWVSYGDMSGTKGDQGNEGPDALETAIKHDPSVTNYDTWRESIRGGDGADGLSSYEFVKLTYPEVDTPEKYVEFIRGTKGDKGEKGDQGEISPSLNYKTELISVEELPTTGESGDAYLIEGHFWGWSIIENKFVDLGPVQGPQGRKGDQGIQGEVGPAGKSALEVAMENDPEITSYAAWKKSLKGDKGDRGHYWYTEDRDPTPIDGLVGDVFVNLLTLDMFRKTGQVVWAPTGKLGGGNLYMPTPNGKTQAIKDGEWTDVPFDSIEVDGQYVGTKEGWKRFDTYDVVANDLGATGQTLDVVNQGMWHINLEGTYDVTVPNYPVEGRSKVLVLVVHGSTGTLNVNGRVNWGASGKPTLGEDYTVLNLLWDNVGNQWLGSTGSSGANLA